MSALPVGEQSDRAWAEYAGVCRVYARLVQVLALIGVDERGTDALIRSDDQFFERAIAASYRENIEGQGYAWLPELAIARTGTAGRRTVTTLTKGGN